MPLPVLPLQVQIVAHGVEKELCRAEALAPLPPELRNSPELSFLSGARRFKFLYKGGALWRKGIDTLLTAYSNAFTAADDVTLIMHITYGDPEVFQMINIKLQVLNNNPNAAHIMLVSTALTHQQNIALYSIIDTYVHPARAEG